MPRFSAQSLARLEQCDPQLQRLFHRVVIRYDCTILVGHRDQETQERMRAEGKSKLSWPDSKHNSMPSRAVDAIPYHGKAGIDWEDRERFILFAGYVLAVADEMGIQIRWGGDWNGNRLTSDDGWDLVHFELRNG